MLSILLCVWTCGVSAPLDYYQQVTQQVMQGAATRNAGTSRRLRQLSNQLRQIARSCTQLHKLPRRLLTNGSPRGKAWRALHAQSRRRELCRSLRAAYRFLGPTTIPFPSSHAQTGRGIQPGCQHTHNARARDARITSCKGRLA